MALHFFRSMVYSRSSIPLTSSTERLSDVIPMRSRNIIWIIVIISIAAGGLRVALTKTRVPQPVTDSRFLMGTIVEIRVFGSQRALDAAFRRIQDIDATMGRTGLDSEVYRINQAAGKEWVPVSQDTFQVVETAVEYAKLTAGLFDPSIAPLVDLWGIGTAKARIPSLEEIKIAQSLIDYGDIELDPTGPAIRLQHEAMALDLGGIAKGYGADAAVEVLKRSGISSAFLSLGGNVYVIGSKPDGSPWRIGIQDPDSPRGTHITVLEVKDTSVVTSGPYERYFIKDGIRYHHILDPTTGFPADSGLVSVTIVTPSSLIADALSTGVFVLGLEKGLDLLESLEDVEGILVTNDREVYATSGLRGRLNGLAKGYSLYERQ